VTLFKLKKMARPIKNNLDYFSHDKDMRNDLKIKALRRKFSHKGYSIYVMMLEHLSNCEYLQYEWNELSIELLTSDFDIDNDELMEIIDYSIKLKLFDIEVGYIFCPSMLTRNQHILSERKCFDLNNSPITKLNRDLLSKSPINSGETQLLGSKTEISTHSIVKESKEKNSTVKESKEEYSKVEEIKVEDIESKNLDRLLRIMKDVIADNLMSKESIKNLNLSTTREMIGEILLDYSAWERDLINLGSESFLRKLPSKTATEPDYILYSLIKAHEIL